MLKELPIGISSFEKSRQNGLLYVDKTKFVSELVKSGDYYFLSRPRRFGKSFFLDTLKQAFLAKRELFKGLYLENNWDWSKTYPIIHISFASGEIKSPEILDGKILELLRFNADNYQIELTEPTLSGKFRELIIKLFHKLNQQVVILIDEYDKPVLDNITNLTISSEMRSGLRNLYSVIKDCDFYIKFVFITGISRFIKTGIFSTLNNLNDITLNSKYADICGYTQAELEYSFADYLADVDKNRLKLWYNGYNFLGTDAQKVYNPFGILLFLDNNKQFANYWFSNAAPSYLINLIKTKNYILPNFENMQMPTNVLDGFDIENIGIEALLFQTGYITIVGVAEQPYSGILTYIMNYPNFEVRQSLTSNLLSGYFGNIPPTNPI